MGKQLLLLHGAGLGGWIWHRVTPELRVPAQAIDLPGRGPGAEPGKVTMQDCVDHLTALLMAADEPPIIVAHSFSASIALAAASEQPGGVRAIVLVGGLVQESGKNFLSLLPPVPRVVLNVVIRLSPGGVRLPSSAVKKEYCSDLDLATTALVVERVTREAPRLYLDPVEWSRVPPNIPTIYVKLLQDRSVSPERQGEMITRVRATRIETIDSGHLPMLSRPHEMAELLNRIGTQFN